MGDVVSREEEDRIQLELAKSGVLREVVSVFPLGGGVSSDVYDVVTTADRLVVKFALAQLKVDEPWFASLSRATVERKAIQVAAAHTPGHVPELLGWSGDGGLVMRHLGDLVCWKVELLTGGGAAGVGEELASLLATWQDIAPEHLGELDPHATDNFFELRTRPFYLAAAQRRPDLASTIEALVEEAREADGRLVHGDFSPKNIMVGRTVVVLDWEVAHVGDPAYDPAFVVSHLLLKAIAVPRSGAAAAADAFLSTLADLRPDHPWRRTWRHVGALMLARLVGTSRVDYLTAEQQITAELLARRLLLHPHAGPTSTASVLAGHDTI